MFIDKDNLDNIEEDKKKKKTANEELTEEDNDFYGSYSLKDISITKPKKKKNLFSKLKKRAPKKKETKEEIEYDQDFYSQSSLPSVENTSEVYEEDYNNTNNKNIGYILVIGLIIVASIWTLFTLIKNNRSNYSVETTFTSFGIVKNNAYQLNLLTKDKNGARYKIDDNDIIHLNKTTGYIEALKEGNISFKILNSKNKEQNTVNVYVVNQKINVEDFIVPFDIKLEKKETNLINISLEPYNATELNFKFKSSDPSIVTVDNSGIMEAIKKGNAIITVENKNITKDINITVK